MPETPAGSERSEPRARPPASDALRRAGNVAWAVVGIAALLAVLGFVALQVAIIFPPLILAGAIVFLLNPIVTRLHNRGIPRAVGAGLTYLGVAAVIGASALLIVPLASDQVDQFRDDWPEVREKAERWVDDRAEDSEDWLIQLPTVQEIEDEFSNDEESLSEQFRRVREIGVQVFHVLLIVVLSPIIAFYLLVDLPKTRRIAESLVPAPAHDEVMVVGRRLNRAIGGFFRGQLVVALIVGVMCSIGLAVIGLDFWFLVGMIAGLFNLIPLIGPWIGGVPGVVIALTTGNLVQAGLVVAIMAGVQQIDNHFITPFVMQRAVRLHPAAVMLALLAGGTLGGFFGLLLAVPTAAVLKILIGHVWRVHILGEPLELAVAEEAAADEEPGVGMVKDVVAESLTEDEGEEASPPVRAPS